MTRAFEPAQQTALARQAQLPPAEPADAESNPAKAPTGSTVKKKGRQPSKTSSDGAAAACET